MSVTTQSAQEFSNICGTVTTLDLRTPAEVASEYIDGCVCLPVQELTPERFEALLEQHQSQGPVHLLCQSGKRAQMAVNKLQGKTKRPLVIIEGGLNALKTHNVEVKTGSKNVISLERQVRITAGFLVVLGVLLGFTVSPYFFALSGFVGAGLMFAGITDTCGMALVLARMPWNQ